jgi:nitrate reductase gamma subunit
MWIVTVAIVMAVPMWERRLHRREVRRLRESQRVFAMLILDVLTVNGRLSLSPEQMDALMEVMDGGMVVTQKVVRRDE